jgi:hypothetical protein
VARTVLMLFVMLLSIFNTNRLDSAGGVLSKRCLAPKRGAIYATQKPGGKNNFLSGGEKNGRPTRGAP